MQGVGVSEDSRQPGSCQQMELGVEWSELSPSVTGLDTRVGMTRECMGGGSISYCCFLI